MKQSKSVKVRLIQNQSIWTININYKLVIEKILKIVIRQVLMIYIVYSAQKWTLHLHILHNFKTCFIYFQQFLVWLFVNINDGLWLTMTDYENIIILQVKWMLKCLIQ